MRYLLGLRGTALRPGWLGTNARRNAAQIEAHITTYLTLFDVDGDGSTTAATDGLLVAACSVCLDRRSPGRERPSVRTDTDITNAVDSPDAAKGDLAGPRRECGLLWPRLLQRIEMRGAGSCCGCRLLVADHPEQADRESPHRPPAARCARTAGDPELDVGHHRSGLF